MIKTVLFVFAVLALSSCSTKEMVSTPMPKPDFVEAEKEIQFINPAEATTLPQKARETLASEKCLIPKTLDGYGSAWIKGSFAKKGQTDWAVLCSDNEGQSKIKVIWGGSQKPCPGSLSVSENKTFLQVVDTNKVAFSRVLNLKKPTRKDTSKFQKEGISDGFAEKGSTVFFCMAGNWQSQVGAD